MLEQLTKAGLTYCIPDLRVLVNLPVLTMAVKQCLGYKFSENMDFLCCSTHQRAGWGLTQGQGAHCLSWHGTRVSVGKGLLEEVGERVVGD